jgi:hypothetical protein
MALATALFARHSLDHSQAPTGRDLASASFIDNPSKPGAMLPHY